MRYLLIFLSILLFQSSALAWGKRGHSLVCETGAYLASDTSKQAKFLKPHSMDFAYYCNVPDLIWKRPDNYKKEWVNHFMNLEVYDRKFGEDKAPYRLSRKEFNKKYPDIPRTRGRSWWRIQEFNSDISKITKKLKKKMNRKGKHKLQGEWFTRIGIMGHYIGDLAMPLHVSENYDGQLSNQKGLHHYFEEEMIYHLYLTPGFGLQEKVYAKAKKMWPKVFTKTRKMNILELAQDLSRNSLMAAKTLLEIDKKTGRKNLEKSKKAYQDFAVERLALGSIYYGIVIKRQLGWDYDGKEFFYFSEAPEFIKPPK